MRSSHDAAVVNGASRVTRCYASHSGRVVGNEDDGRAHLRCPLNFSTAEPGPVAGALSQSKRDDDLPELAVKMTV
jgi:hypothetical protein